MTYIDFRYEGIEAGVRADASGLPFPVLMPRQTHSCRVGVIRSAGDAGDFPDTDALVSFLPGVRIGVRTADCVPLLLYAPDIRAVAAVHAGWKGSLGGIVTGTVDVLKSCGASPAWIQAAFGPSVCGRCYEVSPEMVSDFRQAGFSNCVIGERNLDLESVNRRRLVMCGVDPANIRHSLVCTRQTPSLPSWRRDPGTPSRLVTWIRIRGGEEY